MMQGGPSQMHSQMHWDGYSLPASQLPYAIPTHPLPPYVYNDAIDPAFQVLTKFFPFCAGGEHLVRTAILMQDHAALRAIDGLMKWKATLH